MVDSGMTRTAAWEQIEGVPFPLGANYLGGEEAWNFAVYSKHATAVRLVLFGDEQCEQPCFAYQLDPRRNKSGPIWHCRLKDQAIRDCHYYGYQVDGPPPEGSFEWHSFDVQKLLLDPYARDVHFPPRFSREVARQPGSNVGRAPTGILRDGEQPFRWRDQVRPRHTSDLVIYEMHVRGFTRHDSSGVDADRRGTFMGVVDKIPYLQQLGVTAVELMPVFQFDPQEGNYWGYMPLNFFSPHHLYASHPDSRHADIEFRQMVDALHGAGIEVILDVVYNHTCEGNHLGPIYSYKGFDNSTYYMLTGNPQAPYANYSGTGNTLHTVNRAVRQLILDSLRYWVKEMHVDGFRFDLASIFSRASDGSLSLGDPPIFGQIASDPELATVRLIAEPWDAGGAWQLGRRFPGVLWRQWNAFYRDTLQRFVRGDLGMVPDLMTRIYGSSDLFPDDRFHAMRPYQSVNYVTSHDGFTLYDLVSYNHKNNWANGHQNLDGHDDFSWNCGWEGEQGAPSAVLDLRKRQVKNFCTLLMLSNGTPMFRMGDEFLQTQQGNSNPYNQDNETTWLDWQRLSEQAEVFEFFRRMIAFRKDHPSLHRSTFWRDDIQWYGVAHLPDLSYHSRTLAFCLHGATVGDNDLYVMINAWQEDLRFGIHEGLPGHWQLAVDTAREPPDEIPAAEDRPTVASRFYDVRARSVVVLISRN